MRLNILFVLYILTVIILLISGLLLWQKSPPQFTPLTFPIMQKKLIQSPEYAKVVRVVDGDTIEIENKKKVRYIGINTPETVDPRRAVECFGKEASAINKKLVEGITVRLEKDVSESDKYDRLLRYVWIEDKNSSHSGTFVNDYLLRQGYAQVSTFPPDVKYTNQFIQAQHEAQKNNRGLWNICK